MDHNWLKWPKAVLFMEHSASIMPVAINCLSLAEIAPACATMAQRFNDHSSNEQSSRREERKSPKM